MANKRLGTAANELRLPTKKVKGEKKPKWQAKTGGKKGKEPVVETTEVVDEGVHNLLPEPATSPALATTPEEGVGVPATLEQTPTATELTAPNEPETEAQPATPVDEPTPAKSKKLKVKADLKPKKISMVAAALQVLQDRKVSMTCPELIDVMATEGIWTSPGGKTPANTLYAAISRDIKDNGTASSFRKAERGKFEAMVPR